MINSIQEVFGDANEMEKFKTPDRLLVPRAAHIFEIL